MALPTPLPTSSSVLSSPLSTRAARAATGARRALVLALVQATLAGGLQGAWAASAPRDATDAAPPPSRQVQQAFALAETCDSGRVQEAVSLIYEQGDLDTPTLIAAHCEALAASQSRPLYLALAARIKALMAMRIKDMAALKRAGETLVTHAQVPEYVADGHMFIAFACLFGGGDTQCARTHVDLARSMFTDLKIAHALRQLQPLEQTLTRLEAQDARP